MKRKLKTILSLLLVLMTKSYCDSLDTLTVPQEVLDYDSVRVSLTHYLIMNNIGCDIEFYYYPTDEVCRIVCNSNNEARRLFYYLYTCRDYYTSKVYKNGGTYPFLYEDEEAPIDSQIGIKGAPALDTAYSNRLYFIINYFGTNRKELNSNVYVDALNPVYKDRAGLSGTVVKYEGKVKRLIESIPKGRFLDTLRDFGLDKKTLPSSIVPINEKEWLFSIDQFQN